MSVAAGNVPDTIRRGILLLRLMAGIVLADCVTGFIAATIVVERTEELLGAPALSMSEFFDLSVIFQIAFAVALIILSGKLAIANNAFRVSGLVLSALTLLGGIIGLFSMFNSMQAYEAVTRVLGADILPGWLLPVSVVLSLAQMLLAVVAMVNLGSAESAAFSAGDSV